MLFSHTHTFKKSYTEKQTHTHIHTYLHTYIHAYRHSPSHIYGSCTFKNHFYRSQYQKLIFQFGNHKPNLGNYKIRLKLRLEIKYFWKWFYIQENKTFHCGSGPSQEYYEGPLPFFMCLTVLPKASEHFGIMSLVFQLRKKKVPRVCCLSRVKSR